MTAPGRFTWTTPTGHTYVREPEPALDPIGRPDPYTTPLTGPAVTRDLGPPPF